MKLSLFAAAVLLASACSMSANASPFTVYGTNGSGGVTALPGQTVGYGFTFFNSSGYTFLVSSQVDTQPIYASNYLDFIGLNFIDEILPGQSLTELYGVTTNPDGSQVFSGLGEFSVDTDAPNYTYSGSVTLYVDTFSTDPYTDPNATYVSQTFSAPIGLQVVDEYAPTPEPSTFLLLGTGLLGLCWCLRAGSQRKAT
jgi:hypothetical protein